MSRVLDFSQKRVLEITKPDGNRASLVLRRVPLAEAPAFRKAAEDRAAKQEAGDITDEEFVLSSLEALFENFVRDDFKSCESSELGDILDAASALRNKRTEDEKKTP